ncbi:RNA-binding protein 34 [Callorhinchus milii]|uniref:RNA-binding protein 34 n=1 Tax=Callorhinchus milii TaxID=7868 RepID=UPI001C3F5877|nr:RNA-binding protein 34 [Callorhinchus milii]
MRMSGSPGANRMTSENTISEDYVVGQVAGSLFQKKKTKKKANSLASLFSSPATAAKPIFLPVQESNVGGRKRRFSEESDTEKINKQKKLKKVGPPVQKVLKAAERRLAERERALSTADEEDKQVKNTKQKKNKKRALGSKSETSTGDGETVLTGLQPEKGTKPRARKKATIQPIDRIKNKRTLFVGNLPSDCTKQMLVSLFKEFGAIESVRFRSLARVEPSISRKLATIQRNVHPKRRNLNAYVVFKVEDDAVKAVKRNGHEIKKGFHIRVDLASKSNVHNHGKSIFIGNLSYEIEEDEVRQHFSDCGPIESVRIVRDRESGMGKGFGYVLFQVRLNTVVPHYYILHYNAGWLIAGVECGP